MTRWWVILIAAIAGIGFTGLQIIERITTLRDPSTSLACDINAVLSCSNVLAAWQSSVMFGIPNAFLGAVMFTVLGTVSSLRLLGTVLTPQVVVGAAGISLFFAAFATWFMLQTAFVIGALCLWCIAITTSIGVIGAIFTATAAAQTRLAILSRSGLIWTLWGGWWILVMGLVAIGLT
jgi:uncharacterized membrane protein